MTRMKGEIGLIPQHNPSKHPQPLPGHSHYCAMVMLLCQELSGSGRSSPGLSGSPECAPGDFHAQKPSHSSQLVPSPGQ